MVPAVIGRRFAHITSTPGHNAYPSSSHTHAMRCQFGSFGRPEVGCWAGRSKEATRGEKQPEYQTSNVRHPPPQSCWWPANCIGGPQLGEPFEAPTEIRRCGGVDHPETQPQPLYIMYWRGCFLNDGRPSMKVDPASHTHHQHNKEPASNAAALP